MSAALLLAAYKESGDISMTDVQYLACWLLLAAVWLYYRQQAKRQQAKADHPANNVPKEDTK